MSEFTPKIEVMNAPQEQVVGFIHNMLNRKSGFDRSAGIYKRLPELEGLLKDEEDIDKRKEITTNFIEGVYKENETIFNNKIKVFNEAWQEINEDLMKSLSEVYETNWSEKESSIAARLSPNGVCPRNLDNLTFDVYYKAPTDRMIAIAVHEISHFIWFKKWMELFPDTPREELNSPHLCWQFSEMVTGVVLNDERIQKTFNHFFSAYRQYYELDVGEKNIIENLQDIYDSRDDFEDFIRKGWKFVQQNEEELNELV